MLTKFNQEMKEKVIELRRAGYGCVRMSKVLGVSETTARNWIKRCGVDNIKVTHNVHRKKIKCKNCGDEVLMKHPRAKFCGEKCRSRYNKKNRGNKKICPQCNSEFIHYSNKFCSNSCSENYLTDQKNRTKHRNAILSLVNALRSIKDCECCGKRFHGYRNSRCCSKECYRFYYHNKTYTPTMFNHKCRECGKHYTDTQSNSAGCSDECKRRWYNRVNETRRRNRLRENGKIDWDISVERLVKRDKGYCYLCGDKVNMNDYIVNSNGVIIAGERYPSIDHVIPVSKGGTHTWGNVRLAHRNCNAEKNDKIIQSPSLNFQST